MPTVLTHPAIPLALRAVTGGAVTSQRLLWVAALGSVLPDIDALGFFVGIPYGSLFGHRGLTHSLAFALLLACCALPLCAVAPGSKGVGVRRRLPRHGLPWPPRCPHRRRARSRVLQPVLQRALLLSLATDSRLADRHPGGLLPGRAPRIRCGAPLHLAALSPRGRDGRSRAEIVGWRARDIGLASGQDRHVLRHRFRPRRRVERRRDHRKNVPLPGPRAPGGGAQRRIGRCSPRPSRTSKGRLRDSPINPAPPVLRTSRRSKPAEPLRVSMFYGYDDHDGKVHDRAHAQSMAHVLTSQCRGGLSTCGFALVSRSSSTVRLMRTIAGRKVEVSPLHELTGGGRNGRHEASSASEELDGLGRSVKDHFLRELVESDIVFYMGHSRLGGSIGFDQQTGVTTVVNAVFRRPMLPVLEALRQRPTRLRILGMFSCELEQVLPPGVSERQSRRSP